MSVQVVIVPIVKKETDRAGVMQAVEALQSAAQQAGIRCKLDASTEKTPGWKFNHYEMKVPFLNLAGPAALEASCVAVQQAAFLSPGRAGAARVIQS